MTGQYKYTQHKSVMYVYRKIIYNLFSGGLLTKKVVIVVAIVLE